ncbi:MAG TPA: hypothetical protein VFK10_15735, partial [Burkholderiaceae bacterium]|nr:hypothetical protein [Burkholderiaceae bacterium]
GWALADMAVHPSGDVTVVLTTARAVRLVRLDRHAAVLSDQPFLDAQAPSDPYFAFGSAVKDDEALQPVLTHDAARVAALGESLALVLRTGRNAVVVYRLDRTAAGYQLAWRVLVEPGTSILGLGVTGGTFDVFGQLENHVHVALDVDASGTLGIGVSERPFFNFAFEAHAAQFGEPITARHGCLLTRVSGDGHRLGTTVIDTQQQAELHGVRATPGGFALVGRVLSEVRADGGGWDGFVAIVSAAGRAGPYAVIDVDRGDVLFDIAALPSGRYLAVGATGYTQNPSGASVSEDAQPLLAVLDAGGAFARRLPFAGGPRHNQLDTIAAHGSTWLVAGMRDGPGTHSGDSDRALIRADGFVREPASDPDLEVPPQ